MLARAEDYHAVNRPQSMDEVIAGLVTRHPLKSRMTAVLPIFPPRMLQRSVRGAGLLELGCEKGLFFGVDRQLIREPFTGDVIRNFATARGLIEQQILGDDCVLLAHTKTNVGPPNNDNHPKHCCRCP